MKIIGNYKLLAGVFIAGLALMGVGAGVGFFEFQSMTYCGEKVVGADNITESEYEFDIPSEGNIAYGNADLVEDETVSDNKIKVCVKGYENTTVDVGFRDGEFYYINSISSRISNKRYIPMYVNYSFGYNSDFNNFKAFLSDVKQRQIYNYKSAPVEITIKMSPTNIDRFKFMSNEWNTFSTDLPVNVSDDTVIYYDNDTTDYYTMDENGNKRYLTGTDEKSETTTTGNDMEDTINE
jgi:hypothetical protein